MRPGNNQAFFFLIFVDNQAFLSMGLPEKATLTLIPYLMGPGNNLNISTSTYFQGCFFIGVSYFQG